MNNRIDDNIEPEPAMTFEEWLNSRYDLFQLADIVETGIGNGYPGLTTYGEIIPVYDAYRDAIWEWIDRAYEDSEYIDIVTYLANMMIGSCNKLEDFISYLVWIAVDQYADEMLQDPVNAEIVYGEKETESDELTEGEQDGKE